MATRRASCRMPAQAEILAALDGIRSAVDALQALIVDDAVSATVAAAAEPATVVDDAPEWTTLANAAALCRVHVDTMASRCRAHGLGWRAGGRDYRVDMVRVRKWEQGLHYSRLPATTVPEGSGKPGKVPDASRDRRAPD